MSQDTHLQTPSSPLQFIEGMIELLFVSYQLSININMLNQIVTIMIVAINIDKVNVQIMNALMQV